MKRLSVMIKIILLSAFCVYISGCKVNDNTQISPSIEPAKVTPSTEPISPSIKPEAADTSVTIEPAYADIEHEDKEGIKYVKGNSVNMREAPGLDSAIIFQLNSGTEIKLIKNEGSWSRVVYNDIIGYIHNDYLSDTIAVQEAATAASVTENTMPERLNSPFIKVKKSERILELWDGESLFASYPIGLGWEPEGDKKKEGDGRTPEGSYYVCTRNGNSRFYLSLGVSYPNIEDAREGLDNGLINRSTYEQIVNAIDDKACPPWNTALGGEIMIHGMGSSSDWTAGCIAVDNDVMDILWKYCPLKTPITIEP